MANKRNRASLIFLSLGDMLMIVLAFDLSGFARYGNFSSAWVFYKYPFFMLVVIYLLSFYIFTLYEHYERFKSSFFLSRFLTSVIFSLLITAVLSYYIFSFRMARGMMLLCASYIILFVSLWRFIFDNLSTSNIIRKRVVIIGAGHVGQFIYKIMKYNRNFNIICFIDDDQEKHHSFLEDVKVVGGAEHLPIMAKNNLFDLAIVAISDVKKEILLDNLLIVKTSGIQIVDMTTIYEEITGRIPMSHIRLGWIIFTSINGMSRHLFINFKRYIDIFLSLFGLIINLPIIFILAILIKIDSKGPLIYRQQRVGKGGKVFLMYKFRSMVVDAENKEGGLYTSMTDARVTRVGGVIRKFRMDEIPQLWNILIGNMSFVGPRPEAVELSQKYEKEIQYYSLRHIVKPGLTGWAQIKFSYSASTKDALQKFEYDMFYIKNMSVLLDIQIILKTITVIIFREFSR